MGQCLQNEGDEPWEHLKESLKKNEGRERAQKTGEARNNVEVNSNRTVP